MKVLQNIYWSDMHPNQSQEARMLDMKDACYSAYCFALDGILSGKYSITQDNMYFVIDNYMKPDWIDERPPKICPMTIIRYVIREACNNWLDEEDTKDKEYLCAYLKQKHENKIFIPHSGVKSTNSVQIERVGRVAIDPVDIPTRIHLVIAHYDDGKWRAEIRAALN